MRILKSYADFLKQISAHDLFEGLLGYGMFADKLPPCFTSVPLYQFYERRKGQNLERRTWHNYIVFDSQRNTTVPRRLGIPAPAAYYNLCRVLSDNWDYIKQSMLDAVSAQNYMVSRIHLRKSKDTKALFSMQYKNWKTDGNPETDLLLGNRYVVKADISTCFPSIYTHSIPWALVGKENSKENLDKKMWFNQIDKACCCCKNGETHGLLIGPHASNLISEIILTQVDQRLWGMGWRYIRAIDDFTCYVSSFEAAERFIADLRREMEVYDLILNDKKTLIQRLPFAMNHNWVQKLRATQEIYCGKEPMGYRDVAGYLSEAIALMEETNNNAAPLNYALKVLAQKKMTEPAKDYCVKIILHMACIYPYLVHYLEDYVFSVYRVSVDQIQKFSDFLFENGLHQSQYEMIYFALYFAWKYGFKLNKASADDIISTNSCICKILAFMYFDASHDTDEIKKLKNHAEAYEKDATEFDRNWLFAYEVLGADKLEKEWKAYKKAGVSFIRKRTEKDQMGET